MVDKEVNKILLMNELFDIYGELISDVKQQIFIDYYEENLSLSEIADNRNISRNAVYDALKKSEQYLLNYENKLHIREKMKKNNQELKKLYEEKHLDDYAYKMLKGE